MSVSSLEKKIKKLSEQLLEYRKKNMHYTKELKEAKASLSKAKKDSKKTRRVIKGGDGTKLCSQQDDDSYYKIGDKKTIGLLVETLTNNMPNHPHETDSTEKSNVVHLAVSITKEQFNAIDIKVGDRVFFRENIPTIETKEIRDNSIKDYDDRNFIILSVEKITDKIDNRDRADDEKDIILILDRAVNLKRSKQYYMYHTIHPILTDKKTCDDREFAIKNGYQRFYFPYIV